ncbi:MAG: biliverdin-producing heme oxygenase [Myxococcales bacterium]
MVLERLRAATTVAHHRLEGAVGLLPEPTRGRYAWFLSRQYGFQRPLEARRQAFASRHPELGVFATVPRHRALLEADLAWLGIDAGRLPWCRSLPVLESEARALGALYVVEGSALGARVLSRRIGEALGLNPRRGLAFLAGGGEDVGPRWRRVVGGLEAYGAAHPEATGELVAGAEGCFAVLERWFAEGP